MKNLLFFALLIVVVAGCKKEDPIILEDCERLNFGDICFMNSTAEDIIIDIDGNSYELPSTLNQCLYDVSSGVHSFTARTVTFSHTWTGSVDVISCETENRTLIR